MSALVFHHPRWLHSLIAEWFCFFWTACPLCSRMFGGHEWNHEHQTIDVPGARTGQAVCPWCAGCPETLAHEGRQWIST